MARRGKGFGVLVDMREVDRALRVLPAACDRRANTSLRDAGRLFQNAMVKSFRPRGSRSDEWLQARTGTLRRSVKYQVSGKQLTDLTLSVFSSGTKYANLQENGGTIRPRNAKYLTIPIEDNILPSGVPRYPSAKDLRRETNFFVRPAQRNARGRFRKDKLRGARTFVLKAKTGKLYIILRQANGKSKLLWALVKSVYIPPRFGFRKTWNEQAPMRAKLFQDAMSAAVADAVGKAKTL